MNRTATSPRREAQERPAQIRVRLRRRAGFTLIEVMVSVALLSTAFVSLLALQRQSVAAHDRIRRLTVASMIAEDTMERMILRAQGFDQVLEVNEELTREYPDYEVEAVLDDVDPAVLPIVMLLPQGMTIKSILVEVSWRDGSQRRTYQLRHYVTQKII